MFIMKNAIKNIARTKGRNVLVGIIVLVIAVSSCISLAIQNAAASAREMGMQNISVTATITADQEKLRNEAMQSSGTTTTTGRQRMGGPMSMPSLTLDQYKSYSDFEEVSDFYYADQISLSKAGDDFVPYTDTSTSTDSNSSTEGPGGRGGKMVVAGMTADFSLTGYSSASAMTTFYKDKTSSVVDGEVFGFDDAKVDGAYEAIINKTLAATNGLEVGDTFTLANPSNSAEVYTFKLTGIYENVATTDSQMAGIQTAAAMKAENAIYVNALATASIEENSAVAPVATTGPGGEASTSKLTSRVSCTYVLGDKASYEKFVTDTKNAGLSDSFKVYSADVENYDKSLVPLDNLSNFASTLLLIILLVGAIILVVLTIFNIRERKYEIGVYTAIGIKKPKVAIQFGVELLVVTLISILVGAGIGAIANQPIANAMLESQVQSVQADATAQASQFGPGRDGAGPRIGGINLKPGEQSNANVTYIDSIDSGVNGMTILELLLIGVGLAAIAGIVSASFVMRYEPLQILADRS